MTTTAELVRHGVDLVEECDEPCREGIVPITDHSGDVRLGEIGIGIIGAWRPLPVEPSNKAARR